MSDQLLHPIDHPLPTTQAWIGEPSPVGPPVTLSCSGPVEVGDMRTAVLAVRRAISRFESLHDRIEVRIERSTNAAHQTPYRLDVGIFGPAHHLRAGAEGGTIDEAASLVHDRLRRLLRGD
jgi:hypothetical protein